MDALGCLHSTNHASRAVFSGQGARARKQASPTPPWPSLRSHTDTCATASATTSWHPNSQQPGATLYLTPAGNGLENEAGEDDAEVDDGWQHVIWSLAPRACLSAGAAPHDARLVLALRHAFDRWGHRPEGGWYIKGVGKTAYANWSVVQLGQVFRLAISQDPLAVVGALASVGDHRGAERALILLDRSNRTAKVVIAGRLGRPCTSEAR